MFNICKNKSNPLMIIIALSPQWVSTLLSSKPSQTSTISRVSISRDLHSSSILQHSHKIIIFKTISSVNHVILQKKVFPPSKAISLRNRNSLQLRIMWNQLLLVRQFLRILLISLANRIWKKSRITLQILNLKIIWQKILKGKSRRLFK